MKAMILAAGFGTRLGELTKEIPKGMLDVDGYPILAWIVSNLRRAGVKEVAMNLHFLPEMIEDYFQDGSRFGVSIHYSYEKELLGTAGGTKRVGDFFDDDFFVHYGDIVSDQDLGVMVEKHKRMEAEATLLLHERAQSNSVVSLGDEERIVGFLERPTNEERQGVDSQWVNSGIAVLNPLILEGVKSDVASDLPRDVYSAVVHDQRLYGVGLTGLRWAIDSPDRLIAARNAASAGELKIHPSDWDKEANR